MIGLPMFGHVWPPPVEILSDPAPVATFRFNLPGEAQGFNKWSYLGALRPN